MPVLFKPRFCECGVKLVEGVGGCNERVGKSGDLPKSQTADRERRSLNVYL